MAWNEPGGNNNRDPWGKRNQSPPDIDQLIGQFIKKIRNLFKKGGEPLNRPGEPSSPKNYQLNITIGLSIIVIAWALSGLFIVGPAEQSVVLRFGKFSDVYQPGVHWMARFIDTKYTVDVHKVYSFTIDGEFLTKSTEQSDLSPKQSTAIVDPSLDTADKSKNLVNVELNVQYVISDPRAYLFNVVSPDDTIQQVAAGALSDVIGKMKLDDVLTTGREVLSSGVLEQLKQVLGSYNTGLSVVSVVLRKAQAPDQVRDAFNDVNTADQDRATYIQQAQAYASKVVPLARGVAARILADANAYQQQAVLTAQAQVARYQALLAAYKASPELTRERIYLETLQNVFSKSSKILVDANNNNMLYLPLDKMIPPKIASNRENSSEENHQNDSSNKSVPSEQR